MRRTILTLLAALALTGPAHSAPLVTETPELELVASTIAGQQLRVLCYVHDEPGDPLVWDAWGYVYLFAADVHLSREVCEGALAIVHHDLSVPLALQGLGALVLTHESYHLKAELPEWRRASEAQTECRAVKRVRQTMIDLGATGELADAILPWSLAAHFKITSLAEQYDWPGCAVPVFADYWP